MVAAIPSFTHLEDDSPLQLSVYIPPTEGLSSVRVGIAISSLPLLTNMRRAAKVASDTPLPPGIKPGYCPYALSPQVVRSEIPKCLCAATNRSPESIGDILYSCASAGTHASLRSPVTKFLGPCDFSLTHIIDALSTRLTVHILMLLLADR